MTDNLKNQNITIIGATSGPGKSLLLRLARQDYRVRGIGRDAKKVAVLRTELKGTRAEISAIDVSEDQSFLTSTDILIHCSQPELTKHLVSHKIGRFIGLGSTRRFTRFPDQKCRDLMEMEERVMASPVPSTILHPTLIYGADGLHNIERIIATARVSPLIPLPAGGMSLIQPIHSDDVVDAIVNCLYDDHLINKSIVIAGPSPMTYRTFVTKVIDTMGLSARVVSMPYPVTWTLAKLTRFLPGLPTIASEEIERLLEDKHFDVLDMQRLVQINPRGFDDGMAQYAATLKGEPDRA